MLVLLQGNGERHLQTKRTKKKKNENEVQKKIISADMEKLKSRSVQMSQTIDLLEKEFFECIDMVLVVKGPPLLSTDYCHLSIKEIKVC